MDMCRDMGFKMDMCSRDVGFTMDSCSREGGSKMDLCGRAGFGCGGRMVVVESECRGWVVMRIGIRSFVERESQSPECHNWEARERREHSQKVHSLTIRAAPLQIPFSIVSYLNSGPTISCKCGFVLATLKL